VTRNAQDFRGAGKVNPGGLQGLVRDNLVNTLNGYVQEVCPVSKPLKRESKARAAGR